MNPARLLTLLALLTALLVAAPASAQLLIPRDEHLDPLRLRLHDVDVEITDNGAVTHVTQVFENRTSQDLEATYYFAIPAGSVTTDFALWMNGERIRGQVLRREEARATYEGIVRRMRDPGLLEYVDGELFQASIYPVPAHGEQRVEIEFANVLPSEGGVLHYRYPFHASAAAEIPTLVMSGDIRSAHSITNVYSPYHDIDTDVSRDGHTAHFSLESSSASTSRDFELFIQQSGEDLGFSLLTFEADDGGDAYFMMTLAPSPELEDLEVLPKRVTFVVDTSGSMAGAKIEQARDMLRYCVSNLSERDELQIISFSSTVRPLFDSPRLATRDALRDASAFIDGLSARGNTNISDALERALRDRASSDRPHSIIFVTDGLPTEGNTNIDDIIELARAGVSDGDRRVFAFGVGYDVNTRLLDGIARRGRGETGYVRPNEDLSDVVGTFYSSIGSPLLTQIAIEFSGVRVRDMYPNPLPDLYRDREVVVFGRVAADHSSSVTVTGRAGGRPYTMEYGADFARFDGADTSFVGNLWARRKIDSLLAEIDERGASQRTVDDIVALATRWGIVTPYTSYLAVDPSERISPPPMPVAQPTWRDLDEGGMRPQLDDAAPAPVVRLPRRPLPSTRSP